MGDNEVGVNRFKVSSPQKASPEKYQKAVEALCGQDEKVNINPMATAKKSGHQEGEKKWKKKKSAILKKK